jgi:hypothetical protein
MADSRQGEGEDAPACLRSHRGASPPRGALESRGVVNALSFLGVNYATKAESSRPVVTGGHQE